MLITTNPIVEEQLVSKLQTFGYEVFCKNYFDETSFSDPSLKFVLRGFRLVLFSPTIADSDVNRCIKAILKVPNSVSFVRLTYSSNYKVGVLSSLECIDLSQSVDLLRETLAGLFASKTIILAEESEDIENYNLNLSHLEEGVLEVLESSRGKFFSRQDICQRLWNEEANHMRMTQLSLLIRNIRGKFSKCGIDPNLIVTKWGEGYKLES
ncbi:helix-turn-helix domain-containing protein [Enterococcus gilvus]|uniref:winged helix-turn-helix domain-containing protein n=1 Tax=Enterococcus gilvus TaxID=160453 RepID=UPI003D6BEE2C